MMTGNVIDLHALLKITFCLPDNTKRELEFVIDTGFTGFLTLPIADILALELPFRYRIPTYLADNSEIQIPVYDGTILWNGIEHSVNVLATGQRPLLGTALLKDCELFVQFAENGLVTVDNV